MSSFPQSGISNTIFFFNIYTFPNRFFFFFNVNRFSYQYYVFFFFFYALTINSSVIFLSIILMF